MSRDLRPGPRSPPAYELHSAEDTLGILRQVLHPIATDDLAKQTLCTECDLSRLNEHLLKSISGIGGMADADIPAPDATDSVERQVTPRPGPPWMPGTAVAWTAPSVSAKRVDRPGGMRHLLHRISGARFGLRGRGGARDRCPAPVGRVRAGPRAHGDPAGIPWPRGVRRPVEVPDDAGALEKLVAFTGRNPAV